MRKIILSVVLVFLIFFTSIIKNSTKKIDAKIFNLKENIRLLNEKYEKSYLFYCNNYFNFFYFNNKKFHKKN